MLKKIALFAGALIGFAFLIAGPLFLTKRSQFKAMASAPMYMPTTIVTAQAVSAQKWENVINATGSLVPVQGVTVAAEMPGKIVKIAFEPGATVKAGDVLLQLDTSTEEAQLRAAEATA